MSELLRRSVFTEKYPPFGLKSIIEKKFEAARCREYESAAKYRDEEINYYRDKYGYDIRHAPLKPKQKNYEPEFNELSKELQDFIFKILNTEE